MYGSLGVIGRHCLYELQDGNPALLDDEDFIKNVLVEAADLAGATLLQLISHKFEPQGVTAVALLAESHLSIHTYPEHGYAAVDGFTCGSHTDPEAACKHIGKALESKSGSIQLVTRRNSNFSRDPVLAGVR